MRKTVLLLSLLALVALPAVADQVTTGEETPSAVAAPAQSVAPPADAAACDARPAPAADDADLLAPLAKAAGTCPLGGPQCRRSSDCTEYCSDPHAHCSHQTGCCLCPL